MSGDPWMRAAVLAFCLPLLLALLCGVVDWLRDLWAWLFRGEPPPSPGQSYRWRR